MKFFTTTRFSLVALVLLSGACLAEPAATIRPTELRKEPASDADTIDMLAENTAVDARERKGGWTRVKTQSGEGWVRMLSLRYSGTARQGDSGISKLFNVARTGTSGTQVTTGVRGLDEADLANAQPNQAELDKMKGFAAGREAAAGFAAKGKLAPAKVDYPAP